MKRNHRKTVKMSSLILLFLSMSFLLLSPLASGEESTPSSSVNGKGIQLEVRSAILLEVSTGQILYQSNADVAYPPASMSKMMTEYIVLDEIKNGRLSWEDTVVASQNAQDTGGSKVFLAAGDKHTVKQLFTAMAVGSANDATVALAEHISGTQEAFAKKMNETARRLKLSTAHYINATGLSRSDMNIQDRPKSIEGETVMSARDAANLALAIQQDHPDFFEISSLPTFQFRQRDEKPIINYNWMLEGNKDVLSLRSYAYQGLDGMKTGYTDEAGYCFTGTAVRDGVRLISVVMGTNSESARFEETKKLLDYGFNRFELKTVLPGKSQIETLKTLKVSKGKQKEVALETANDLKFIVEKGTTPQLEIKAKPLEKSKLVAPVKQGTVLATATVTYKNENAEINVATINLISSNDIEKAHWFRLLLQSIGNFLISLFNEIIGLF
ncbi:MAG: D-alanyl-D-alanine carboxypeptidase [Paenibacillus sp.]|nr:D-alanyl-D-alanine carboxypeptidase [Paenibacillus sp.]